MKLTPERLAELLDVLRNQQAIVGCALDELKDNDVRADAKEAWRKSRAVFDRLQVYTPAGHDLVLPHE